MRALRELKLVEKYKGSLLLRFAVIVLAVFVDAGAND